MKKFLLSLVLLTCLKVSKAAPPFWPTKIATYPNSLFGLTVTNPSSQDLSCFGILPDGTCTWDCNLIRQMGLPSSLFHMQITKRPERPKSKIIDISSGQNYSPFLPPPINVGGQFGNFIQAGQYTNPSLHIDGAAQLFSAFNHYNALAPNATDSEIIKIQNKLVGEMGAREFFGLRGEERQSYLEQNAKEYLPYYIAVIAIENDSCPKAIDGIVTLRTDANLSINNTTTTSLNSFSNAAFSGIFIPPIWSANTDVVDVLPSNNSQYSTEQEIRIEFNGLEYGEQRLLYAAFTTNPNVSIGTNIECHLRFYTTSPSSCKHIEEDPIEIPVMHWPHDPNCKETSKPIMSPFVDSEETRYSIHYENEGKNFATHVLLKDVLPIGIDPNSFELIDTNDGLCPEVIIVGRTIFIFIKNKYLPGLDQEFPKQYAPEACRGWVRFSVRTDGEHDDGDFISNKAEIYFMSEVINQICQPYNSSETNSFLPSFTSDDISEFAKIPLLTITTLSIKRPNNSQLL